MLARKHFELKHIIIAAPRIKKKKDEREERMMMKKRRSIENWRIALFENVCHPHRISSFIHIYTARDEMNKIQNRIIMCSAHRHSALGSNLKKVYRDSKRDQKKSLK